MSACPICGKPARPRASNTAFPFCSPRCKQIDLGKWFDEKYRVPTGDSADDGEEQGSHEHDHDKHKGDAD